MQSSIISGGTSSAYEKVSTHERPPPPHNHHHNDDFRSDEPLLNVPAPEEAAQMTVAVSSTPTVQVSAPADLPEGYEFTATLGTGEQRKTIKVTVPVGGVEKGQTFAVPLTPTEISDFTTSSTAGGTGGGSGGTISIPVGHWRDGLFQFYKYGICHPHCWTSCCCTTCKLCMNVPSFARVLERTVLCS